MVTPTATDFAQEWIAAWNSHDLDRILSHYAEAVEFVSPFIVKLTGRADGRQHGKSALRDYFARGLAAYPDLRFELHRVYEGVGGLVLEYQSVNGLRAAEAMEFDAGGQVCRVRAHYTAPAGQGA